MSRRENYTTLHSSVKPPFSLHRDQSLLTPGPRARFQTRPSGEGGNLPHSPGSRSRFLRRAPARALAVCKLPALPTPGGCPPRSALLPLGPSSSGAVGAAAPPLGSRPPPRPPRPHLPRLRAPLPPPPRRPDPSSPSGGLRARGAVSAELPRAEAAGKACGSRAGGRGAVRAGESRRRGERGRGRAAEPGRAGAVAARAVERRPSPCGGSRQSCAGDRRDQRRALGREVPENRAESGAGFLGDTRLSGRGNNAASRREPAPGARAPRGRAALSPRSPRALGLARGVAQIRSLTGIRKLLVPTFPAKWFSGLRGCSQDVTPQIPREELRLDRTLLGNKPLGGRRWCKHLERFPLAPDVQPNALRVEMKSHLQ